MGLHNASRALTSTSAIGFIRDPPLARLLRFRRSPAWNRIVLQRPTAITAKQRRCDRSVARRHRSTFVPWTLAILLALRPRLRQTENDRELCPPDANRAFAFLAQLLLCRSSCVRPRPAPSRLFEIPGALPLRSRPRRERSGSLFVARSRRFQSANGQSNSFACHTCVLRPFTSTVFVTHMHRARATTLFVTHAQIAMFFS
jgi:hypothetical protein